SPLTESCQGAGFSKLNARFFSSDSAEIDSQRLAAGTLRAGAKRRQTCASRVGLSCAHINSVSIISRSQGRMTVESSVACAQRACTTLRAEEVTVFCL